MTVYIMKPYSRIILDRSKAIFNYRLSRARRVVECVFGICASKWRILNKASETDVGTGVKTVQLRVCTTLHQTIVAAWMQRAVLI